jgi:serine phosphatase RsbU (regulator of sigma subunit)
MSPGNEIFGLERLQELLKRKHDFKLDRICSDIEISLSEFQEDQQSDDITMLALKRII